MSRSRLAIGAFGFAAIAAVACTASSVDDTVGEVLPQNPDPGGAQLPPSSSGSTSSSSGDVDPTPPSDGGKKDATVDAGPPPPDPGTPCTVADEIRTKKCGACGKQETICLGGTWSQYSACAGELAGGCIPGTTATEACGNCGTRTKTCNNSCTWSSTACGGQPANACTPGGVELASAGCTTANTFRSRTCTATCAWNTFTTTCAPPPTTIEVPPAPGGVNYTYVVLKGTQTVKRIENDCPMSTFATDITPYAWVQVHNGNAQKAVVTVFNSQAPGGPIFETTLAAYGATKPATDAARKACAVGVAEYSEPTTTGDDRFAALEDFYEVPIAAGATIWVYNAAYNAGDVGQLKLSVRLDRFE